jgi:L-aspartate oxidase
MTTVAVLGGGVAGLSYALKVAKAGTVAVLTMRARHESNTNYAQGGIAAVFAPDDDPTLHADVMLPKGATGKVQRIGLAEKLGLMPDG